MASIELAIMASFIDITPVTWDRDHDYGQTARCDTNLDAFRLMHKYKASSSKMARQDCQALPKMLSKQNDLIDIFRHYCYQNRKFYLELTVHT